MGGAALASHAKGATQRGDAAACESTPSLAFSPNVTRTASWSASLSSTIKRGTILGAVSGNKAAEVPWALKVASSHYS